MINADSAYLTPGRPTATSDSQREGPWAVSARVDTPGRPAPGGRGRH